MPDALIVPQDRYATAILGCDPSEEPWNFLVITAQTMLSLLVGRSREMAIESQAVRFHESISLGFLDLRTVTNHLDPGFTLEPYSITHKIGSLVKLANDLKSLEPDSYLVTNVCLPVFTNALITYYPLLRHIGQCRVTPPLVFDNDVLSAGFKSMVTYVRANIPHIISEGANS